MWLCSDIGMPITGYTCGLKRKAKEITVLQGEAFSAATGHGEEMAVYERFPRGWNSPCTRPEIQLPRTESKDRNKIEGRLREISG
jgi:hypothetical protein